MNVLEVRGVSWRREQDWILSDINWTVSAGEHWVVLGENGSGKTSLLNMVTGYTWPTKGRLTVLGNEYGRCDIREVRRHIGWVNAAFGSQIRESRPNDTALDIVLSGKFGSIGIHDDLDAGDVEQALAMIERFGCGHLSDKRFVQLSQGETQRVLLARAWMANPRLLILDEPCTGLDLAAREQLLRSIEMMGRADDAPTLIYVTHHVEEVLPVFTHVLLMQGGRVLFAGPKEAALTDKCLSEVFGVRVEVAWRRDRPWIAVV